MNNYSTYVAFTFPSIVLDSSYHTQALEGFFEEPIDQNDGYDGWQPADENGMVQFIYDDVPQGAMNIVKLLQLAGIPFHYESEPDCATPGYLAIYDGQHTYQQIIKGPDSEPYVSVCHGIVNAAQLKNARAYEALYARIFNSQKAGSQPIEHACCAQCGSEDVRLDADATWNDDLQDWELNATYDNAFCPVCDGPTRIAMRPLQHGLQAGSSDS